MKKFSFALNTRNKTPKALHHGTSSWQLLRSPPNLVKSIHVLLLLFPGHVLRYAYLYFSF